MSASTKNAYHLLLLNRQQRKTEIPSDIAWHSSPWSTNFWKLWKQPQNSKCEKSEMKHIPNKEPQILGTNKQNLDAHMTWYSDLCIPVLLCEWFNNNLAQTLPALHFCMCMPQLDISYTNTQLCSHSNSFSIWVQELGHTSVALKAMGTKIPMDLQNQMPSVYMNYT